VQLIKEIGDEVFLVCPHLRPLFESMILIYQTARQLSAVAGDSDFPFTVRMAIGQGTVKRLNRTSPDFLGTPIDQLSRLMSLRSDRTRFMIHEDAFRNAGDVLREYSEFLSVGDPTPLSKGESKSMISHVFYRELYVDHAKLLGFGKHFVPWASSRPDAGE